MRKAINKVTVSGKLYDISKLSLKQVKNENSEKFGQDFIGGSISVATDDECMNVVEVHFTFLQPTYKSGKKNNTFYALKDLMESGKTVLKDGAEAASMITVDGSVGVNDFYTNRNGEEKLVSAKRIMGSFVNNVTERAKDPNRFECDMVINNVTHVEADEERNIPTDYCVIKGCTFDFQKNMLPIELKVKSAGGMKYFESLDITPKNLVFTKVWGDVISEEHIKRIEEESAFDGPQVKEVKRSVKEWVVTGTSKPDAVYEIGDEEKGITEEELKKAMADRELHLADVKKKQEEYEASKNSGNAASSATAPAAAGGFNF